MLYFEVMPSKRLIPFTLQSDGKVVGRLHFVFEMDQVSEVTVHFEEVRLKGLQIMDADHPMNGVNPYLKYGYSKDWYVLEQLCLCCPC